MPPANVSYMEAGERRLIIDWYRAATSGQPVDVASNQRIRLDQDGYSR
jgi:hypothetical protein